MMPAFFCCSVLTIDAIFANQFYNGSTILELVMHQHHKEEKKLPYHGANQFVE